MLQKAFFLAAFLVSAVPCGRLNGTGMSSSLCINNQKQSATFVTRSASHEALLWSKQKATHFFSGVALEGRSVQSTFSSKPLWKTPQKQVENTFFLVSTEQVFSINVEARWEWRDLCEGQHDTENLLWRSLNSKSSKPNKIDAKLPWTRTSICPKMKPQTSNVTKGKLVFSTIGVDMRKLSKSVCCSLKTRDADIIFYFTWLWHTDGANKVKAIDRHWHLSSRWLCLNLLTELRLSRHLIRQPIILL